MQQGGRDHLPHELGAATDESVRLSIAINTHYPNVLGGYYVNPRLLSAIGAVLNKLSLYLVNEEYHCESHDLPVENMLAIETDQPYLVCDENGFVSGRMVKWQFDAGGGGKFFGDNLIVDMRIHVDLAETISDELRQVCIAETIGFE